MAETQLPYRPRRGDPNAAIIVNRNVEELRDKFDKFRASILRGSATIITGNTAVTVSHSADVSTYSVSVTPTTDPGARFWVSGKTSTQFVINLSAAPAGNVSFDWILKEA